MEEANGSESMPKYIFFFSFLCEQNGNVVCEEEKCPVLNCLLTEQWPGQCCPQCKGNHNHFVQNLQLMVSSCENDNDNDLVKMTLMIQFATVEVLVAPPDMLQIQKMK